MSSLGGIYMFIFSPKRFKGSLSLTTNDLVLLHKICDLGFVNSSQLSMLYSVVQGYPVLFPRTILSKWCQYSGLLLKRPKSKATTASAVPRSIYIPTKACRTFLSQQGIALGTDPLVAVNSHNEQAIEVVVQSLYASAFKSLSYGIATPAIDSSLFFVSLGQPDKPIKYMHPEQDSQIELNQNTKPDKQIQIQMHSDGTFSIHKHSDKNNQILANQIMHSEKTTRKGVAATSSAITSWIKKHCQSLNDYKDLPLSSNIPIVSKTLFDSVLDGYISSASLQRINLYPIYGNKSFNTLQSANDSGNGNTISKQNSAIQSNISVSINSDDRKANDVAKGGFKDAGLATDLVNTSGPRYSSKPIISDWYSESASSDFKDSDKSSNSTRDAVKSHDSKAKQPSSNVTKAQEALDQLLSGMQAQAEKKNDTNKSHIRLKPLINTPSNSLTSSKHKATNKPNTTGMYIDVHNNTDINIDEDKHSQKAPIKSKESLTLSKDSGSNSTNTTGMYIDVHNNTKKDIDCDNSSQQGQSQNDKSLTPSKDSELYEGGCTGMYIDRHDNTEKDIDRDSSSQQGQFQSDKSLTPSRDSKLYEGGRTGMYMNVHNCTNMDVGFHYAFYSDSLIAEVSIPDKSESLSNAFRAGVLNLKLWSQSLSNNLSSLTFRYPSADFDNLLRNINLINNRNFDPTLFDTSSFKNQYKYQQYTFVADETISFERHGRRQEIFVELDNRTEANNTQIQKILNYISYALDHPQRDILLVMAITDGSLPTNKVKQYGNLGRKLSSLSSRFLKSFLADDNGEKHYLYEMYLQATNLKIVLTGVSEAQIDTAQFILGSNYTLDYLNSIQQYTKQLNEVSQWEVQFIPSEEFKTLINNPRLASTSINDLDQPIKGSQGNGIWQYTRSRTKTPFLGKLIFDNKLALTKFIQPVIAGDEHSLDTIIQTYEQIYLAEQKDDQCPPLVVYPTRERPVTAITLNQYKELYNWLPTWRPTIPVLLQPQCGLGNNVQLHQELRWLTLQYDRDIYNYFQFGAVNKSALKKHPDYGSEFVHPLKWAINSHTRSYAELHKLSLQMNKQSFIDQLRLNEIPLDLFRTVLERWPKGAYSLPLIQNLPYLNPVQLQNIQHPTHNQIFDYVFAPNAVTPSSRINLKLSNTY